MNSNVPIFRFLFHRFGNWNSRNPISYFVEGDVSTLIFTPVSLSGMVNVMSIAVVLILAGAFYSGV